MRLLQDRETVLALRAARGVDLDHEAATVAAQAVLALACLAVVLVAALT